jgi:hypothetical protein
MKSDWQKITTAIAGNSIQEAAHFKYQGHMKWIKAWARKFKKKKIKLFVEQFAEQ